jgi:hypothetical protein
MATAAISTGLLLGLTALSTGVSVAGAAGAFDKGAPKIPGRSDPRVQEARQRQLRAARNAKGVKGSILTPLGADAPEVQSATLLGQSGKAA